MLEILTTDEMKKADAATIADGIPARQLIEAAGVAVAHKIADLFKKISVLVLCGSGNNGADGIVTAERLKRAGWPVRIAVFDKDRKKYPEAETLNSNLSLKETGLVVDAIFGTGFHGALEPEIITLFDKIRTRKIPVIAVDIPSGVDGTSGTIAEGALKADITVTFCRKKIAHMLYPSREFCGKTHVAQIGITDDIIARLNGQIFENNPALWIRDFPIPDATSHKYTRGFVTVFGGNIRTGAACLAGHAAQVAGAGAVAITTLPETRPIYSHYRASIMVDVWQTIEDLKSLLRDERRNTLVLGPGGGEMRDVVEALLGLNKISIIDADALTAFKDDPQALFSKLSSQCVLTPHAGEFHKLFGDLPGNKIDQARTAARKSGAIVVFKGGDTIIAEPDGAIIVNSAAPPNLATAGSGDVLTGLIAGLSAQGMPPFMAAACACWLQTQAARKQGFGLTAEDIIRHIPQVLNQLFTPPTGDR